MSRYIDAEILECKIDEMQDELLTNDDLLWDINKPYYAGLAMARGFLNDMPTADVQEVKHANWVHLGGDEWCCSCCGFGKHTEGYWEKPNAKYCEKCGAEINGVEQ